MRKHRVIRQEVIAADGLFQFDVETTSFDNLMVTYDNSAGTGASFSSIMPTVNRNNNVDVNVAALPLSAMVIPLGGVSYTAIGVGCQIAFPLPDMLTVKVIAVGRLTVRVEGDYHESKAPDPTEDYTRNRR